MRPASLCALILLHLAVAYAKKDDSFSKNCIGTVKGGKTFDFNALNNGFDGALTIMIPEKVSITLSFCTALDLLSLGCSPQAGGTPNVMAFGKATTQCIPFAFADDSPVVTDLTAMPGMEGAGDGGVIGQTITWTPTAGDNANICAAGKFYTTDVHVLTPTRGDKSVVELVQGAHSGDDLCVYWMLVKATLSKADYDAYFGNGGISGGTIFLILLLVVVILYFVLGCVYQRKKNGTTGMVESIPQSEFWMGLPSLIKDGCVFTAEKLKACPCPCCKRNDPTGYSDDL